MKATNRRSIMETLAGLPVFAAIGSLKAMASERGSVGQGGDSYESYLHAVQILRWTNTGERCHFEVRGHYEEPGNLLRAEEVRRLLESDEAESRGIGRSLYSTLRFGESEIIPGWHFEFKHAGGSQQRYLWGAQCGRC
jgi:hypothetical protein